MIQIPKSEICRILPDVSPTTVEAILGKMVKEKKVQIIGNGKIQDIKKMNNIIISKKVKSLY
ncbi:MAG: hypothetical protein E7311_04905 [Clostridiales bacterium]|nr:hypothetical protein [Clostridiales bacterium]